MCDPHRFPVDAKEYIALLPLDENGQNESGEVYLYAFARTESGDPMLSNIESDEEYAKAAVAFDTVLQNDKSIQMEKIELRSKNNYSNSGILWNCYKLFYQNVTVHSVHSNTKTPLRITSNQ